MKEDISQFPVKTFEELKLSNKEIQAVQNEIVSYNENLLKFEWPQLATNAYSSGHCVPSGMCLRYEFSRYIVDPNRYRFKTAVRIIAIKTFC